MTEAEQLALVKFYDIDPNGRFNCSTHNAPYLPIDTLFY
jgi:hypothetical protein